MVKCALCGAEYEGEACPNCGGDVVILDFVPEFPPEEKNPVEVTSFTEKKEEIYRRNALIIKEQEMLELQKQTAENNLRAKQRNELEKKAIIKGRKMLLGIGIAVVMISVFALFTAVSVWDNYGAKNSVQENQQITLAELPQVTTVKTSQPEKIRTTKAETEQIIEETAAPVKYDPLIAAEKQYYFENEKLSATLEFTDIHSVRCYFGLVKKQEIREEDYVLFAEMCVKNISDEPITVNPQALQLMGGSSTYRIDTPITEDGLGIATAGEPFELAPDTSQTVQLAFACKGRDDEVRKVKLLEYTDFDVSCPDMDGLCFANAEGGYMVQESLLENLGSTAKVNPPLTPQTGEYSVTTDVMSYCFSVKRSASPNFVIVKMRMQNLTNYARYIHPERFSLIHINVSGKEQGSGFYDLSCDESLLYKVETSDVNIPEAEGIIYDRPMYLTMQPDGYAEYTFYFHVQDLDENFVALEYDTEDAVYEYGQDKFRVEIDI